MNLKPMVYLKLRLIMAKNHFINIGIVASIPISTNLAQLTLIDFK